MSFSTPVLVGSLIGASVGTALLTTLVLLVAYRKRAPYRSTEVPTPSPAPPFQRNYWSPQPKQYQSTERQLVTKVRQTHIIDRVNYLRTSIEISVHGLVWKEFAKEEGGDRPVGLSPTDLTSLFQQHQYTDTGLPFNHDLLAKFLPGKDEGKHVLASIISWIIISNISLEGDSRFNLLSPILTEIYKLCRSSHTDAWNEWVWEKARVYIRQNLWPGIEPTEMVTYECYREPLNNDATTRIMALLEDLLDPFVTITDGNRNKLYQSLVSAAYLGLFIHKDLRPWRWCFEYSGERNCIPETDQMRWRDQDPDEYYVQDGGLLFSEDGKPVYKSPILPPLPQEAQCPFLQLGEQFKVPSDRIVRHPALFIVGDASGMHFKEPMVALPAGYAPRS